MHRISPTNPVRRRLFPADDVTQEATVDNFANLLQESSTRDKEEKMRKWNFDFENEVPLEGDYEWYKYEGNQWIGISPETTIDQSKEEDSFLPMKLENESTPKSTKEEESAPLVRKRRKDDTCIVEKGVRRRISFD